MIVKLLTEHHLEFLSLKGGCRGSSESTHVKILHCWKFHATAHFVAQCIHNFIVLGRLRVRTPSPDFVLDFFFTYCYCPASQE